MPRARFISLFSSLKPTESVSLPNFPVTLGFRNGSCFFLFFLKKDKQGSQMELTEFQPKAEK